MRRAFRRLRVRGSGARRRRGARRGRWPALAGAVALASLAAALVPDTPRAGGEAFLAAAGAAAAPTPMSPADLRTVRAGRPASSAAVAPRASGKARFAVILWDELGPIRDGGRPPSERRSPRRVSVSIRHAP